MKDFEVSRLHYAKIEFPPPFEVAETTCLVIQTAQKTFQYLDLTSNRQGPEIRPFPAQADFSRSVHLKNKLTKKPNTQKKPKPKLLAMVSPPKNNVAEHERGACDMRTFAV